MDKIYLGDSVYYRFDGYHIVLTTENGLGASNEIFLEPEVIKALIEAVKKEPLLKEVTNVLRHG